MDTKWTVERELKILEKWRSSEMFQFNKNTKKKIYSIDTPPPYVNSPVHIAQAVTYCYMDFFARYRRMKGFEVIFPLGLDRNGLPIEMAAEKKFNVSPFIVGRDKFLEYCQKLINEGSEGTKESFAKLGISFTSYKEGNHIGAVYLTDSDDYRALTQATFIDLYKKGLVYEDKRITNWDPKLRTTLADSEIDYENIPSTFSFIKWKIKGTEDFVVIATTRPELICTCGMVIFNPEDDRYKKLDGKILISPLFNKEIQLKAHPLAQIDKGTGIVMMCSAGDLSDIQFFREQNLIPVIAINQDGTMNEKAGFLNGLKVKEARKKIIEMLTEKNILIKQEFISHRTPISERSKAEIEFIEMPEFYLKQLDFIKEIRKVSEKIKFYPAESKKILDFWLDMIAIDWPISRRRYYATEIPLWHCKDKNLIAIPKPGKYYKPWKEKPIFSEETEVYKDGKKVGALNDAEFKKENWVGEERVFDTWMDSSISELYTLKYRQDDEFFKKAFPSSLRPQGKEIVRTWLYYTILRGYLETGKPCFDDVWIHQHLLDEKGRKMSKSIGNVIDPKDLLKEYGAEAIRFWAAIEGDLAKQDLSVSKERIKAESKTITKLLNVANFILQFGKPTRIPKLTELDQLFIDYMNELTNFTDDNYKEYNFHYPVVKIRNFLWEIFASHYIELVKARAYNQEGKFSNEESESAKYALHFLLERLLFLLYPVIPQVTTEIAKEKGIELLKEEWPKAKKVEADFGVIEKLLNFNTEIWKKKREQNLSLRSEISGIKIPKKLKNFEGDLRECHGLK